MADPQQRQFVNNKEINENPHYHKKRGEEMLEFRKRGGKHIGRARLYNSST